VSEGFQCLKTGTVWLKKRTVTENTKHMSLLSRSVGNWSRGRKTLTKYPGTLGWSLCEGLSIPRFKKLILFKTSKNEAQVDRYDSKSCSDKGLWIL
jgi:hypothetical protein